MQEISKTYDPKSVESKWYKYWEENDLFHTDTDSGKRPYCIMMPPPNITGALHMGHALQDALQDMLIRVKRMQGYEALWQPGKDHAGIATQNVVEKTLSEQGTSRHELGREGFVERVWQWKEQFGNRIFEQKKLLGDSADWSRERFTLDEGLSGSVAHVFKHLYDKGLIYRGKYIVNWCPRCHTAISDEEVDHEEHDGHLWYFRYPIKDSDDYVTVATTRPETMLGDTAIALNPADERFKHIWSEIVLLPLADRPIPIIRDEFVDPEFGTGQVKVTPAHDPNDFDMGRRHGLDSIVVIDENGAMNDNTPEQFRGMDRFEARDAVVKAMRKLDLLEKIEDYTTSIGHCQRCKTVIEPYLSQQWFVKMKPLAEPAIKAVRDGRIKFYPGRWEKVYYQWMDNIRDWCISRQLWWGHRIPVWYCEECRAEIVSVETPQSCTKCGSDGLKQDEDVLDTWFSSWLWPFSTLGWPEKTKALEFWYPTDVLISGYDIIFFWIARMIMGGLEFTGEIPYRDVYITGMIRDELGRWMSKSLGNGIDPADMIDQYGADAVRFTLVSMASEGQDIKLAPSRFEGGRNFANKLWNSYRFLMSNSEQLGKDVELADLKNLPVDAPLEDRWIISRLNAVTRKVSDNLEKYRLNDCMTGLYDFIWKEYCDWYLELIKIRLSDRQPEELRRETLGRAIAVYETALRLLHPGMPFITEEMWQGFQGVIARNPPLRKTKQSNLSIMLQTYPQPEEMLQDPIAETEMGFLQRMIVAIRNIRAEMRVAPGKKADVVIGLCNNEKRELLKATGELVKRLATIGELSFSDNRPPQSAVAVVDGNEVYMPLAGLIDMDVERKRLDKEIARLRGVIRGAEAKLNNDKFMEKAPDSIKEHERKKLDDCLAQLEAVERNRAVLDD